jgi:hypothetical protein
MGFIGHCRIVGFEYDIISINLVAHPTGILYGGV